MRFAFILNALALSTSLCAATPIDGWYSGLLGGYAYLPNNVDINKNNQRYMDAIYQAGYFAGGNLGYKSNPMRYEAELTYFNANVKSFDINAIKVPSSSGYNNGVLGMANIYYDFPGILSVIEPYLGVGIGYGWINVKLNDFNTTSPSSVRIGTSAFAYQGMAGLTYNFAENYAIDIGYRYVGTPRIFVLGHMFQSHFANIGVKYRFDNAHYN